MAESDFLHRFFDEQYQFFVERCRFVGEQCRFLEIGPGRSHQISVIFKKLGTLLI
jgi:hypothetical protein